MECGSHYAKKMSILRISGIQPEQIIVAGSDFWVYYGEEK